MHELNGIRQTFLLCVCPASLQFIAISLAVVDVCMYAVNTVCTRYTSSNGFCATIASVVAFAIYFVGSSFAVQMAAKQTVRKNLA